MKAFFLNVILLLPHIIFAQTFRQGFDNNEINGLGNGQGKFSTLHNTYTSYVANVASVIHNSEDQIMESYINMYKATQDKKYLDKFIIHAKRVQERRDDNIKNLSNVSVGLPLTTQLSNNCPYQYVVTDLTSLNQDKGWSVVEERGDNPPRCDWEISRVLHSGLIMFPMAQFVHLILVEKANDYNFITTPLPDEAKIVPSNTNCPVQAMDNYYHFASWLKCRVEETISAHECYWKKETSLGFDATVCRQPNSDYYCYKSYLSIHKVCNGGPGGYVHDCSNNTKSLDAMNMLSAMGRCLVTMYLVNNNAGYLCHIRDIAMVFKKHLTVRTDNFVIPSNLPQANEGSHIWCHSFDCIDGFNEDIWHATWSMHFAELCYSNFLTDYNSNPLFTLSDMKKFGNTIAYRLYESPFNYNMSIDGTNTNCPYYCDVSGQNLPNTGAFYLGGLLAYFSKYNPYIFQQTNEVYQERALYQNQWDFPLPFSYLAMAQSPYFAWNTQWNTNFKFNPVALRPYGNPHNFKGSAVGDFDNDGKNDIVAYDGVRDHFRVHSVGKNPTTPSDVVIEIVIPAVGNSKWINIAAGDLDPSHPGDEFVTVNTLNSNLYLYQQNGNSFSGVNYPVIGSFDWKYIAVADFDVNRPGDEMLAINNSGLCFLAFYDVSSQTVVSNYIGALPVSNAVAMAVGNFDPNNPNVQFATVENGSGHIKIFEYNTSTNTLNTTPLYTYTASGTGNQWRTMTAGDFDEDGVDELLAYRHYDGQVMMFKVKNGALPLVYSEYFPPDQEIAVLASGKFNQFLGGDAFVVLRNYDGKLTVFTMEGQCPGVQLQNTLVDANYTPDNIFSGTQNNYVVDYHANNTLMASNNFVITAPSQVEFTAGKRVVLKPGFKAVNGSKFHAYIDNQLACNTPYLRTGNTAPTQNNEPEPQQQLIEAFNFKVFPNPNTGNFTVYLEESSQAQTVTILNMLGEKISQINTLEQKLEINLSSYPKGVYFVNVQSNKGASTKKVVVN